MHRSRKEENEALHFCERRIDDTTVSHRGVGNPSQKFAEGAMQLHDGSGKFCPLQGCQKRDKHSHCMIISQISIVSLQTMVHLQTFRWYPFRLLQQLGVDLQRLP